jgi:hypothetical protein
MAPSGLDGCEAAPHDQTALASTTPIHAKLSCPRRHGGVLPVAGIRSRIGRRDREAFRARREEPSSLKLRFKRSAGPNVPNASSAALALAAAHDPVICEAGKEKAPAWFRRMTGALSGSSAPQEHRGTNAIPLSLSSTVTALHNSAECDFSAGPCVTVPSDKLP